MHSTIRIAAATALTAAMMMWLPSAAAWSNGGYSADVENPDYGTHDWIADMALDLQTRDVAFLETTYHTEYLLGTEAPDNPDYIGDSVYHHVYYWSSGDLQDDVAADRASDMYDLALGRLAAGDFSVAAYYIGAMTHYISDVGVFGHTMGAYTDWGTEVHHSDYEAEFEDILDTLTGPGGITLGDEDAYDATLSLAHDITFGEGDIKPNVWMDGYYDWADQEFYDSAIASLNAAVSAAAAALNHMMTEAFDEPEPTPDDPDPTNDDPDTEPTLTSVPTPPTDVEAFVDDGRVTVTWYPPSDDGGAAIMDYIVYRWVGGSSAQILATLPNTAQSWTDDSGEPGETYTYAVRARNSVGLSAQSETVTVTIPTPETDVQVLQIITIAIVAALGAGGAMAFRRSRKGR